MIETLSILPGRGISGEHELFDQFDLQLGQVASIVGPAGSGRTTLLEDVESLADEDTASGREVFIDGRRPPREFPSDPAKSPIVLIGQRATSVPDLGPAKLMEVA